MWSCWQGQRWNPVWTHFKLDTLYPFCPYESNILWDETLAYRKSLDQQRREMFTLQNVRIRAADLFKRWAEASKHAILIRHSSCMTTYLLVSSITSNIVLPAVSGLFHTVVIILLSWPWTVTDPPAKLLYQPIDGTSVQTVLCFRNDTLVWVGE
jgi:hypothetical protein